jgi:TolB-like protein
MIITKQLALPIALLLCLGHLAGHTRAQGTLDQRVSELSKQISDGLTENQKRTIAVVEFVDLKGNVTDFGRFMAEELITRLYQTKKFKVIERQLLNKVVTEQKLSLTGMIDQTSAQKLGRLLGVDAIASGTVTDLGKTLRVNARLISTGTGEIFAVASTEIAKDDSVTKLIGARDTEPTNGNDKTGQPTAAQTIDDLGFTFELQPCEMSRSMISCNISIKNNRDDRGLTLEVDGSRLFDELGNSYPAIVARLGNQSGGGPHIDLVSGVTTKARMTFQPLGSQASKIVMLQLHFTSWSDGRTIKFRDVPLVKTSAQ